MKKRITIDILLINDYMNYNSITGDLVWTDSFFKNRIGCLVGSVSQSGYYKTTFRGVTMLCHRIVWAMHYNEQPPEVIDHINGIRTDNRISNLRASSYAHNAENQRCATRSNKTSKYLGVSNFKGRWRAKIKSNGRYVFLGYHPSEDEARDAYIKAKRKLHAGCEI